MLTVVLSGAYQAATAEVASALLHEPKAQQAQSKGSLRRRGNMRMVMPAIGNYRAIPDMDDKTRAGQGKQQAPGAGVLRNPENGS